MQNFNSFVMKMNKHQFCQITKDFFFECKLTVQEWNFLRSCPAFYCVLVWLARENLRESSELLLPKIQLNPINCDHSITKCYQNDNCIKDNYSFITVSVSDLEHFHEDVKHKVHKSDQEWHCHELCLHGMYPWKHSQGLGIETTLINSSRPIIWFSVICILLLYKQSNTYKKSNEIRNCKL